MNTTTQADTITTALGKTRPDGPWKLRNVSETPTSDGFAWSGTLYKGTKRVAHIEQGGCGGDTFLDFDDRTVEAEFDQWATTWGPFTYDEDPNGTVFDHDAETVADAMWVEAIVARERDRSTRGGKTPLLTANGDEYTMSTAALDHPIRVAEIKAKLGDDVRKWDKTTKTYVLL